MIELKFFESAATQSEIPFCLEGSIYCAYIDESLVGFCHFVYEGDYVIVSEVNIYIEDTALVDILVRAALNAAANRMKTHVKVKAGRYADRFIESLDVFTNREALIDDILSSTCCGKE